MKYELVIFDCDGVLVDSEGLSSQVFAEEIGKLGWQISAREVLQRFKGGKFADALAEIEANITEPMPPDFEQLLRRRTFAAFEQDLQPIPGIVQALNALPLPFCVASNGPRNKIELNLGITHLLPLFSDRIFSAYELEIWKPDPAFYLTVAERLGYAKEACLVIEDSYAGMQSATGAGIDVWVYAKDEVDLDIERAGVPVFSHMGELPRLIQEAK
ncbi:MAG: HAD-IA family hydrolase [Saprospiraceae bacterium]|nr:HAD-IA family hydrolase [Saprospiraceae bacterium]